MEYTVLMGTETIGQGSWGKMDKLKEIRLPKGLLEIRLRHIDANAFDGSGAIFMIPLNLQNTYAEAFPEHQSRFYGVKVFRDVGKADIFSPDGEKVREIAIGNE